jgi:hypothetical protein
MTYDVTSPTSTSTRHHCTAPAHPHQKSAHGNASGVARVLLQFFRRSRQVVVLEYGCPACWTLRRTLPPLGDRRRRSQRLRPLRLLIQASLLRRLRSLQRSRVSSQPQFPRPLPRPPRRASSPHQYRACSRRRWPQRLRPRRVSSRLPPRPCPLRTRVAPRTPDG